MPIERWTTAQVLALAPDPGSAKGARGVSSAAKWPTAGVSDELIWGLCRGSGKNPYQTCVDVSEPAYKCSCPSRKFPCKHVLGLLLLWAAGGVAEQTAPDWVEQWRAGRAARAERSAARRAGNGPVDEAAARKRAAQRADRITAGLTELERWLRDQISQGLAGIEQAGHRPYEAMAARLVDAQAPGVAGRVRRLGRLIGVGPRWADRLLGELSLLHLLVTAHRRLDELPPELAATVRAQVGVPVSTQEVLTGPATRDQWHILGQVDLEEDRLLTRRTWLQGATCGRPALLLSFAAPGQSFPADLVPGTVIDADLCWYPGALPMRAALGHRHGPAQPAGAPAGALPIRAALENWSAALAADPWCDTVPMLLAQVVPTGDGHLVDPAGDALALRVGHDRPWWLLAAAGGVPVTVAGEYSPAGFRPLAAWPEGRYVPAPPGDGAPRAPRPLPAELLSAALIGTTRRAFTATGTRVEGRDLRLTGGGAAPAKQGDGTAGDPTDDAGTLLTTTAVAVAYQRAGICAATGRTPIEPAPEETAPLLPAAAARRLDLLLADGGVPGGGEVAQIVLEQWVRAVAERGYRVPAESLPALLDAGRRRSALRPALAVAAGRRGGWLAARRPDWQYLLAEATADPDPADWATGTPGQRLAHLRAVRATDPAAGLALLTASFPTETPEDRARLLGALAIGLCPADEPLLEQALDDRRKEVRQVAVDLLRTLPGSALRQRMTDRALRCVRLDRWTLGRHRLVVTPPRVGGPDGRDDADTATPEFDNRSLRRDGLSTTPPRGTGLGAWLLEEIVAHTPLASWDSFDLRPEELLALPVADDWAPVLHRGLARAAIAQRDAVWGDALVSRAISDGRKAKTLDDSLISQLLEVLPAAEFARHVAAALRRDPQYAYRLPQLHPGPWPGELADAVLEAIDTLARYDRHQYGWHLNELCRIASTAMPADRAGQATELAEALSGHAEGRKASAVAELAATLTFRHEMYEELR